MKPEVCEGSNSVRTILRPPVFRGNLIPSSQPVGRLMYLLLLCCSALAFAATDLTGVKCYSAKQYPSLVPINVIQVPLAITVGLDESAWSTLGWEPDRLAAYKVVKANGDVVPILRLEFPHTPKSGASSYLRIFRPMTS